VLELIWTTPPQELDLAVARTLESQHSNRDQSINIRANRQQLDLVDQAARALGKSRSAFIMDLAYREAANIMLDQVYFQLDEDAFDRFNALLDAPPTDALRTLLNTKAPWD
jgi:uncharacterized protein (DUF1778 family)